ncbi:MAG: cytidine deaminase [Alphaproteobacteria bacterium]
MKPELQNLYNHAKEATNNAYAPYSKFRVGAAVLTEDGEIFKGCNVENASYGGTICAERSAIVSAISQRGKIKIKAIAVATGQETPGAPCGICRQVISEFGPNAPVVYIGKSGLVSRPINELLVDAFTDFESEVA